ncbi:Uncharacterised protein [Escherichia coli]|nr:Uncharacterised protein [Escherichia coli]
MMNYQIDNCIFLPVKDKKNSPKDIVVGLF